VQLWLGECKVNPVPDRCGSTSKSGDALIRILKGKKLRGRKIIMNVVTTATAGVKSIGQEFELNESTEFPKEGTFTVRPASILLKKGDAVEIPNLGFPQHMEWWHFQYEPGYKGKKWGEILKDIGWTEPGLVGKSNKHDKGINGYGQWGLGYKASDLEQPAR
jgi:hypothetical protein